MSAVLHRLPNGVRVAVEPMPGFHSAAVGLHVTSGSRNERAEQNGIAHFLEHMAFKGTPTRTARAIAEEIEDVGGYINAYTGKEMTGYHAQVLGPDVARAFDVIADIVLNPVFADADIELERNVILQEIGAMLDTPEQAVWEWLSEVAYPDQSFGRSILGPAERVSSFGRQDFLAFTGEHYGPDRMIVTAAGAVDADSFIALVERQLGGLESRPRTLFEPPRFVAGERRMRRKLEQAHVAFAFPAPGTRDPDIHAARIYEVALGGGLSSRLFQEIREKRGLCYTIGTYFWPHSDAGTLYVFSGTGAEQLRELTEVAMDELRRAADGFAPDEIERARAQMRAGVLMGLETPSDRRDWLARSIATWDRLPDIDDSLARIAAVTGDDVRRVAETIVSAGGPALALLGPIGGAPRRSALAERLAA